MSYSSSLDFSPGPEYKFSSNIEPEPKDLTVGGLLCSMGLKIYGSKIAVDNLNLSFYEGHITSVRAQWSGKTTMYVTFQYSGVMEAILLNISSNPFIKIELLQLPDRLRYLNLLTVEAGPTCELKVWIRPPDRFILGLPNIGHLVLLKYFISVPVSNKNRRVFQIKMNIPVIS